ncbi:MAG: alpha/beta hydrolase [Burkholderiales bacterium]
MARVVCKPPRPWRGILQIWIGARRPASSALNASYVNVSKEFPMKSQQPLPAHAVDPVPKSALARPVRVVLLSVSWLFVAAPLLLIGRTAMADSGGRASGDARPTVMLVHGAWADGSSWSDVIARLQARGLRVVSVQNQLNSLADDVAEVNRALERETQPVVLVGHSWGGTVITQAGTSDKVTALVYIAAFAPDVGQSTNDLQAGGPVPGYVPLLQADTAGYLWFPQEVMPSWFAQDIPAPHAMLLAAAQNPIRAAAFGDAVSAAAWAAKPSWYLVTDDDRMIAPALQRSMATRIGARVSSVASSHVPFISHPKETVAIVLDAVRRVTRP